MKKLAPCLYALLIGLLGSGIILIMINSFSIPVAITLSGTTYIFLGMWVTHLDRDHRLSTLLCLNMIILVNYLAAVSQTIDLTGPMESASLVRKLSWATFVPMLASVLGWWLYRYSLTNARIFHKAPETIPVLKKRMNQVIQALLPLSLGFLGMFLVMFTGFFSYMLQIKIPVYEFVYPLVFMALAAFMVALKGNWLLNSALICVFPVFYWVILQPLSHPDKWAFSIENNSFRMALMMLLTTTLTLLSGYLSHLYFSEKRKSMPHPKKTHIDLTND